VWGAAPGGYRERFAPFPLTDPALSCSALPGGGQMVVVVHGLGGDREEMERALPALFATRPAGLFMFRWVPYDDRDVLVRRLAVGLSRLHACAPSAQVLVVAHSAGGVLASLSLGRLRDRVEASEPWLTVLTVASPLAGTAHIPPREDDRTEAMFLFDLGHAIIEYPVPSARGVRVVHLRTSPPADKFMETFLDHEPNDPTVGVPGAAQVDLPPELDHDAALAYVTGRIADGSWLRWLGGREATAGVEHSW
jgi:pimeloyl-ACP methyl ester carboxylesterase